MFNTKPKQVHKLGCEWNSRQRRFFIADRREGEATPVVMTPNELVELGVELVVLGTNAMQEKRYQ